MKKINQNHIKSDLYNITVVKLFIHIYYIYYIIKNENF